MLSVGLSYAASTLVGREVKTNRIARAKAYQKLIICIGLALTLSTTILLLVFEKGLVSLYTDLP